ncbi:MAG: glutathione S-transferase family protein [Pseudomonadota bacterium]
MNLALYHGANSVCSIKVRVVLAEKGLEWEDRHIDLPKGEQFSEVFKKVNPAAIVPVLDHDGRLIYESSVISEYVDGLSPENPLMPTDPYLQAKTRVWGTLTLGYHDAVNTLTFASYQRTMLLGKNTPEQLEARWNAMPDQIKARKMRDLMAHGSASEYVPIAFAKLARMCEMMEDDLTDGYLMGDSYSLADALLVGYLFRIKCVACEGLWESRFPRVTDWYARVTARPSMDAAIGPWIDQAAMASIRASGEEAFGTGFEDVLG